MEQKCSLKKHNEYQYRVRIEPLLEEKIRYLCNKYYDKEWSGAIFTKKEGDIIIAKDLYLMDIGNSTYTEWECDLNLSNYHAKNWFNEDINIIHSHNVMNTNFSSTDYATLEELGSKSISFLSLIVNNKGNYSAYYTIRTEVKRKVEAEYKQVGNDGTQIVTEKYDEKEIIVNAYPCIVKCSKNSKKEWEKDIDERIKQINISKKFSKKTIAEENNINEQENSFFSYLL